MRNKTQKGIPGIASLVDCIGRGRWARPAECRELVGVLHQYDLKKTLAGKGVDLPHECRILEVCNPRQAARVLDADMGMNIALPCRISVYEDGGATWIGMARPTALLAGLSESAELRAVAEEVEQATVRMIEQAK